MTFSLPGHIALQEWSSEKKCYLTLVLGLKYELQEWSDKKPATFVKI